MVFLWNQLYCDPLDVGICFDYKGVIRHVAYTFIDNATAFSCIGALSVITYSSYYMKRKQEKTLSELKKNIEKRFTEMTEKEIDSADCIEEYSNSSKTDSVEKEKHTLAVMEREPKAELIKQKEPLAELEGEEAQKIAKFFEGRGESLTKLITIKIATLIDAKKAEITKFFDQQQEKFAELIERGKQLIDYLIEDQKQRLMIENTHMLHDSINRLADFLSDEKIKLTKLLEKSQKHQEVEYKSFRSEILGILERQHHKETLAEPKRKDEQTFDEFIRNEKIELTKWFEEEKRNQKHELQKTQLEPLAELKRMQEKMFEDFKKITELIGKEKEKLTELIGEEQNKLKDFIQTEKQTLAEFIKKQEDECKGIKEDTIEELKRKHEKTLAEPKRKGEQTLTE